MAALDYPNQDATEFTHKPDSIRYFIIRSVEDWDLEPITKDQFHGKRGKKGKQNKDWNK